VQRRRSSLPHPGAPLQHARASLPRARTPVHHARASLPHNRMPLPHGRLSLPHHRPLVPHRRAIWDEARRFGGEARSFRREARPLHREARPLGGEARPLGREARLVPDDGRPFPRAGPALWDSLRSSLRLPGALRGEAKPFWVERWGDLRARSGARWAQAGGTPTLPVRRDRGRITRNEGPRQDLARRIRLGPPASRRPSFLHSPFPHPPPSAPRHCPNATLPASGPVPPSQDFDRYRRQRSRSADHRG
jgi:hypothetical protein